MICPKCQGVTKIVDSRVPGGGIPRSILWMVEQGKRLFGWWCDEFRIRKRQCNDCEEHFLTIETAVDDLADAFDEVQRDASLGKPWREEGSETAA